MESPVITAVMPTYGRKDVVFERGEGNYLYATDGRRYLDFTSGIAVTILASQIKDFGGLRLASAEPGPLIPKLAVLAQALPTLNPMAVAIGVATLITAVVGLSIGIILIAQARGRAIAAGALAEVRARESRYELLMQQILRLRLTPHFSGWSADAWETFSIGSRCTFRRAL